MWQSRFDTSSVNGVQQCDCCRSFVFCQSRFTDVSGLAVAAFDLVYCFLTVLSLSLTLVSSGRKVAIGLCVTRIL